MNPLLKKVVTKLLPLHWEVQGFKNRAWIDGISDARLPAPQPAPGERVKIAFVTSWYGKGISGGAEAECYGLCNGLVQRKNIDVEVVTTTLKEFSSDWNTPVYSPGSKVEDGIKVHRFHPTTPDRRSFHVLNGTKLMPGGTKPLKDRGYQSPVSNNAEAFYLQHMIHSPKMLDYIKSHFNSYDLFVFIPYMFGPTVLGGMLAKEKAVVIPCLHDERYAFMNLYKRLMTAAKASLYHVPAELRLAKEIYGSSLAKPYLLGEAVDTDVKTGNAQRFRDKFGVDKRFVLYAGRKISGKNVPQMVEFFLNSPSAENMNLVLIGKGDLSFANHPQIIELGFIDEQDKIDAYCAADILCQPSLNESFSIVMMEAWLQETPCFVHSDCEVTKDHIVASDGGLCFYDQGSFNIGLEKISNEPAMLATWGKNGRKYVLEHYKPEIILEKFESFVFELTGKPKPT